MKPKLNFAPGILAGLLLLGGVGPYTGYALVRLGYALASQPAYNLAGPLASLPHEKVTAARAAVLAGGGALLLLVGSGLLMTGLKSRKRSTKSSRSFIPAVNSSATTLSELSGLVNTRNHLLPALANYQATQAVTHLVKERNCLRSLVDSLEEGVLLMNNKQQVLVSNPVISKLLNVPAKQLVGRTIAA
jgi:PAS domain-containing protein